MIKITIDGEEVYSAKDFTIKEEMLNTPSVILNNVYPITWEQDRDYVSRFYHPNDYSKCLIMNNTHIPEEPGITVTSTSINADVDTSKKYEYALMGDTQQGLPSGYTQVDYIESSRTQYIDTGVNADSNLRVVLDMAYSDNLSTSSRAMVGTIKSNGSNYIRYHFSLSGGGAWQAYFVTKIETWGTSDLNRHIFDFDAPNKVCKVDNNSSGKFNISSFDTTLNYWLFGRNSDKDNLKAYNATKIYNAKFYYNGTLVRNFVPCLNSSNVAGLYDTVEGKFYENNGTGTFVYGSVAPNPNTPVAIDTVTGGQTISVTGKNLANMDIIGKVPSVSTGRLVNLTNGISSEFIKIDNSDDYILSYSQHVDTEKYIFFYDNSKNYLGYYKGRYVPSGIHINTYSYYSQTTYIKLRFDVRNDLDWVQVERKTTQTSYSPYVSQTYEINLGKNLWGNLPTHTRTNAGYTATQNEDGTITLSGTSTSSGGSITFAQAVDNGIYKKLEAGTYTISCDMATNNKWIQAYDTTNSGSAIATLKDTNGVSFTLSESANVFIRIWISASGVVTDGTYKIQLEKGSQATSYSAYKTPIELCKTNDYQDKIYKDNGKWYLYKEIGKRVLKGNENWVYTNSATTPTPRTVIYVLYSDFNDSQKYYSNRFKYNDTSTSNRLIFQNDKLYVSLDNTLTGIVSGDTNAQKLTKMKTYISNNNIDTYYVLNTPTTTEITDTELINQLESIELYNGINNIIVSGYLPSPLQLHYNYVIEEDISDLLFCGVVKNSGYISLNPRHPHYQTLQILDFKTFLSEGETLDFVIANKTIEEAIEQVISTIEPYGFIKGNIQLLNSSDVIGAYSTKDKTAYDVFNYIADITQSRWTTRLIDENTVAIDFYDPTLLPQGSPIDYTQNYFDENLIDDISYSYGANDYRNKQVMTSSEVYGSILQSQTIVANGYQTQFATELKIGKISSITINGNQMTFATNQEKELGYTADFYYTPGNNFFESADLRSTGQIIIISYLAIVEGRQIITNGTEIDRVATSTGRKGVVARYEDRNDATTSLELQLIGQSYIKYKGVPEIKLNVTTRKNLWNIGDRVTFNAPITELATEYMVKKKEIQRVFANPSSEEVIFYTFELSSSFNMEQAINYFDNQRAKAKGNIGEGEYISRNVDIENIANVIFYDGTCEEVTVDGDNTLNSVLNSPFIN